MKIKRVNLGKLIREKVEEVGYSQAEFARLIGVQRQNITKTIFSKESIDTNMLCLISEVLDCNLFDYFKTMDVADKKEVKATLTIEMGKERKDKTLYFTFGDNAIQISNKE